MVDLHTNFNHNPFFRCSSITIPCFEDSLASAPLSQFVYLKSFQAAHATLHLLRRVLSHVWLMVTTDKERLFLGLSFNPGQVPFNPVEESVARLHQAWLRVGICKEKACGILTQQLRRHPQSLQLWLHMLGPANKGYPQRMSGLKQTPKRLSWLKQTGKRGVHTAFQSPRELQGRTGLHNQAGFQLHSGAL